MTGPYIPVDGGQLNLIGDSLCALPWLRYCVEKEQAQGVIFTGGGFCKAVRPLIANWGWVFRDESAQELGYETTDVPLHQVFQWCNQVNLNLHMAQGYFAIAGYPIPPLPISLPFREDDRDPFEGHIICSPFSRSDHQNNKLWPHARWVEVLNAVKGRRGVAIIGSSADDWSDYIDTDFEILTDYPLPIILGALRRTPLFLSVDNGMSHLAHFGGVSRHGMIYPACLSESFVRNPLGVYVRGNPLDVTVDQVVALAEQILKGGGS